jgi:hypothetical protein
MNFNISTDRKYIQIENIILNTETGLKTNILNPNITILCEILKDQILFSYKNKLFERTDLFSLMKKLVYPLIKHDINLLQEYEIKYSMNLIYEDINTFNNHTYKLINESFDFIKKGISTVGDKLKQAGNFILNKGLPVFFKKLEEILLNPIAIGIDVALSTLGIGKVAGSILWGSLGIWKIYELSTGKIENSIWSYLDIAVCFIGLIFTGAAVNGIKSVIKGAGRDIGVLLKSPAIKPIIKLLGKGFSFILNALVKPIEWLVKKVGGPKIQEIINLAKSKLKNVFDKLNSLFNPASGQKGIKGTVSQGFKSDITKPGQDALKNKSALKSAAIKGAKWGAGTYGAIKGVEYGVNYLNKNKNKNNQENSQENIDDTVFKNAISSEFENALSQMD